MKNDTTLADLLADQTAAKYRDRSHRPAMSLGRYGQPPKPMQIAVMSTKGDRMENRGQHHLGSDMSLAREWAMPSA